MATAKNVTVIPATRNLHTGIPTTSKAKRKVAGYARVSTDSEEQNTEMHHESKKALDLQGLSANF